MPTTSNERKSEVPDTETPTKEQLETRVIDALVEFGEDREGLSGSSRFEDLDVDSLDLVELAQIVEDEYGIEVQDSDLEQVKTVSDVVELVSARL